MQQQMSLFGLSAESFKSPVARVVAPVPGVARIVLAPVFVEPPAAANYSVIRGLALFESGAVRRLLTTTADVVDGRFLAELTAAGFSDWSTDSETDTDGSEDHGQHSWQAWRTTDRFGFEFAINGVWPPVLDAWRRRELQMSGSPTDISICTALEANLVTGLQSELLLAIDWVLDGLPSELRDLLASRPRLSACTARSLLLRANEHGGNAPRYALQALRTENLGLLHMMVHGPHAAPIRQCLFTGQSLPDFLATTFEISRAVFRASLRSFLPLSGEMNLPDDSGLSIGDALETGRDYLACAALLQHLPHDLWPQHYETRSFVAYLRKLEKLRPEWIGGGGLIDGLYELGARAWHPDCLQEIIQAAQRCIAIAAESGHYLTLPKVATALQTYPLKRSRNGRTRVVQRASVEHQLDTLTSLVGGTTNALLVGRFKLARQLPDEIVVKSGYRFFPLKTLSAVRAHGKQVFNCLEYEDLFGTYVAKDSCLFALLDENSDNFGTVQLRVKKLKSGAQKWVLAEAQTRDDLPHLRIAVLALAKMLEAAAATGNTVGDDFL